MNLCSLRVSGESFDVDSLLEAAPFDCDWVWRKGEPGLSLAELMQLSLGKGAPASGKGSGPLSRGSGFRVNFGSLNEPLSLEELQDELREFLESNANCLRELSQRPEVEALQLEFSLLGHESDGKNSTLVNSLYLSREFIQLAARLGLEIEFTVIQAS